MYHYPFFLSSFYSFFFCKNYGLHKNHATWNPLIPIMALHKETLSSQHMNIQPTHGDQASDAGYLWLVNERMLIGQAIMSFLNEIAQMSNFG